MVKKQLPAHVAQQRLSKVAAKQTVASKQQRAVFFEQVKGVSTEALRSPRATQLVDRTRAAKSASFLAQYRRVSR